MCIKTLEDLLYWLVTVWCWHRNPVDESDFQRPSRNAARAFLGVLQQRGIPSSIRITRGMEAAAACGQLRNEYQKLPMQAAEPALA